MTAEQMRSEAVRLMKSRAGKNTYTNGSKRTRFFGDPKEGDPGYSDCSAAVRACIQRAAGIDIGTNTDRQLRNYKMGVVVDKSDAGYPDEKKLLPGDCLYFKGNKNHWKSVGHVEMYTGKNECWGHGSGQGPTKKNLESYCAKRANPDKHYFVAIRWIPNDMPKDGTVAPADPVRHVCVTAAGTWRIRQKPSLTSKTLAFVKQGKVLAYRGNEQTDTKWVRVEIPGSQTTGYISHKAVKAMA